MIDGDGRFSHEVLAYVSSNGCAFGLEAKSGVYLEDFEVDGFVDLHPPPEEHGLWRWSGDGAITDDGEVEFDGSWESLWTDQPESSEPLRPVGGDEILSHDLLLELSGPIVDRMATAVADLRMDPHGDSDGQAEPHTQRPRPGSSEAWSIRAGERLLERARDVADDRPLPGTAGFQTYAWSPEWPTEPGHYWTYRVSDASMAIVEMRLCLTSEGADVTPTERRAYFGGWTATKTAFESHRPANQLLWGPRVDRPAPPALPL